MPTYFRFLALLAFKIFAAEQVDFKSTMLYTVPYGRFLSYFNIIGSRLMLPFWKLV